MTRANLSIYPSSQGSCVAALIDTGIGIRVEMDSGKWGAVMIIHRWSHVYYWTVQDADACKEKI